MGLAASQARFLSLTARKTNVEYEGQQINQQRTTLSNQSAAYYNQMLTISVPTPPSTDTFKTVNYTFTIPGTGNKATIAQITGSSNNATIAFSYAEPEQRAEESTSYTISKTTDNKYYAGTNELTQLVSVLSETASAIASELTSAKQRKDKSSAAVNANDVYYFNAGSDDAPIYKYFAKYDLEKALAPDTIGNKGYSYILTDKDVYKTSKYTNANVVRNADGRVTAITLPGGETVQVSTKTTTDDAAYEDAYNQYTYQTYLYQQQLEQINANTSIIQAQDKKLELRLKQLDTEQSAISTEMESIKSVIKKNSEDSFKTFA